MDAERGTADANDVRVDVDDAADARMSSSQYGFVASVAIFSPAARTHTRSRTRAHAR